RAPGASPLRASPGGPPARRAGPHGGRAARPHVARAVARLPGLPATPRGRPSIPEQPPTDAASGLSQSVAEPDGGAATPKPAEDREGKIARVPVVAGHVEVGRPLYVHVGDEPALELPEDLTELEGELLGDLFAIIEEHADEAAETIDRGRVLQAFVFA